MGLSQQRMSEELGVRQQTVSEWETGMYQPRGGMRTLLALVAERAGFSPDEPEPPTDWTGQPIARLNLKPRTLAALRQAGLSRVGQVLDLWRQGRGKLLELPGLGQRSLEALERALREVGLIY
jgi:transcriptional regulator with XRE-family HTH domain